jgi:hypothetical protein
MPALYRASLQQFLLEDLDFIIGRQSTMTRLGFSEIAADQLESWRDQATILKAALVPFATQDWHILLEYPIPRRGKRVDVVLLADGLIFVIEFKCGACTYDRQAQIQVEDYCLDLRDFHSECRQRLLVPMLVATKAKPAEQPTEAVTDSVAQVWLANEATLPGILQAAVSHYRRAEFLPIDPQRWDSAEYFPTPTIIEAARVLYDGQNVSAISRCHAGVGNLTRTSAAVVRAIQQARSSGSKLICFVTGVPGAGKTLAGLNIIHSRTLHEGSFGSFLSGNGPLVRVLCEALARDHSERVDETIAESRRKVSTFIQNVHRFIDAHFESSSPPPDRVVVFDEAQRAWNREQSLRKFNRDRSEPEIMLDVMARHYGWAVIVALIGSGQEINTGEAGLGEWGRALAERSDVWNVLISPHVATTASDHSGEPLFADVPRGICMSTDDSLHLNIPLRSYKAEAVARFVGALLSRTPEEARRSLAQCREFPIAMTRDVQIARDWLRRRQRGSRRIGLVASSGGRRLRAHGLDVRTELDVENWFLNSRFDVRSSYYLETPATEFGIQGLELDWIGVCWDLDLVPIPAGWNVRAFKGTKWQTVQDETRRRYALNKYRVLLTRAREGMIVWVPRGDDRDLTRPSALYDAIAEYLNSCGLAQV